MAERRTNPAANKTAVAVIDTIDDDHGRVTVAPNDGCVFVCGWALDAGAREFAGIEIDIGGARASGSFDVVRPDVAAAFGAPQRVGFRVTVALDDAVAGHHAVAVRGRRADDSLVPIKLAASLDVVPPLRRLPAGVVPGALVGFVDAVELEAGGRAAGRCARDRPRQGAPSSCAAGPRRPTASRPRWPTPRSTARAWYAA